MKLKLYQQKKDFVAGKSIVGIDPAKQHHQAAVINPFGLQIGKSFSFPVNYEGFHDSLWKKLNSIIPQHAPQNLLFAVETSCNLWKTIAFYLHSNAYSVLLVNPLTTHHSRPLISHDFSKTDPKDAFLVAKNAFDGHYDFYQSLTPLTNQLRQLRKWA